MNDTLEPVRHIAIRVEDALRGEDGPAIGRILSEWDTALDALMRRDRTADESTTLVQELIELNGRWLALAQEHAADLRRMISAIRVRRNASHTIHGAYERARPSTQRFVSHKG